MNHKMVYLDNAATTFPKPNVVYDALDYANRNLAFNAGRGHYQGAQEVSARVEETKAILGSFIGVHGDTISFESSATEALNLIVLGMGLEDGDNVYYSPFEHNAIIRPLFLVAKAKKINLIQLPFNASTWMPDGDSLKNLFIINPPKAVFLSHISNVTGYILPFEEIFSLSKQFGAINILDCAQSLGVLNPTPSKVDFIVFAGHKSLYASFGIAGFYNLTGYPLSVIKSGGTGSDSLNHYRPERGSGRYEAGSLNSVAVYGLNSSLRWLKENPPLVHERKLTEYLMEKLSKIAKIHRFLPESMKNILGIVSFAVDGYIAQDVGTILSDEYNICVRTGYHCSPFVHSFIGSMDSRGTVRVSVGAFTTREDIDYLIEALKTL